MINNSLIYKYYMWLNYHTNKGKSSLTSLVACFILGIVYFRTYWRWYAFGLGNTWLYERYPQKKSGFNFRDGGSGSGVRLILVSGVDSSPSVELLKTIKKHINKINIIKTILIRYLSFIYKFSIKINTFYLF